jgi:hypothetical protein
MQAHSRFDFLVVGNVTRDILEDGSWLSGGAALYAAATATALGLRVAVVTRASSDEDLSQFPPAAVVTRLPAKRTTEFVNTYDGAIRLQKVTATAGTIGSEDVPEELWDVPLVLLGPVAGEVEPTFRQVLTGQVGVGAQGWLRAVDRDGNVVPSAWSGGPTLENSLAVFASVEDAPEERMPGLVREWLGSVPIVIVTAGPLGGHVYLPQGERPIPVFPARQVDPTGAGDVFATAFLARYAETSDPYEATEFAAAAAACSIEGIGISKIPTRDDIASRRGGR